jgi:hypothetical protein
MGIERNRGKVDRDKEGVLVSYLVWVLRLIPFSMRNKMSTSGSLMVGIGVPIVIATLILTPSAKKLSKELEPHMTEYPPIPILMYLTMSTSLIGWVFSTVGPITYLLGLALPDERVRDEADE